jgi:hypothetical protein
MFWKTGNLTPLSVQNLLDCSKTVGNKGCQSGTAHQAFEYVLKNKGLEAEATYPYEGKVRGLPILSLYLTFKHEDTSRNNPLSSELPLGGRFSIYCNCFHYNACHIRH